MCEVVKYPKHSWSESLPLQRHCRDIWSRSRFPNISLLFKIGDGYVIACTITLFTHKIQNQKERINNQQNQVTLKKFPWGKLYQIFPRVRTF